MDTDLSNALGIFIAFATLMLLYSIVVTSLVQATQAVLRLRGRNLWRGLSLILDDERTAKTGDPSGNAFKVLSESAPSIYRMVRKPNKVIDSLLGPDVSWLNASQLRAALERSNDKQSTGFTAAQIDSIVSKFNHTEKASSKRFQFWTRLISIAWAAFIAVYFQLSTPDLLNRLSSSEEARQELITFSEAVLEEQRGDESRAELDVEKTKARSMFYLEPGRDPTFLYRKVPAGSEEQVVIQWDDVSGVLITILLLTLGAPFWFNMLKSAANLRDALSPDDSKGGAKGAAAEADVDEQIRETTEAIAKAVDPLEKAALKSKLGDLRVLKAKMLSV